MQEERERIAKKQKKETDDYIASLPQNRQSTYESGNYTRSSWYTCYTGSKWWRYHYSSGWNKEYSGCD